MRTLFYFRKHHFKHTFLLYKVWSNEPFIMQQKMYACLCVWVCIVWAESEEVQNNLKQWIQKSKWCIRDRSSFSRRMVNTIIFYVGCLIYSTKLHESLHLVCVNVFYARKWTTRVGKSEYGKIIIITKYFESTFVVVNTSILNLSLPPSSSSCFYLFCSFLPHLTMHNILYSPFCVHWL